MRENRKFAQRSRVLKSNEVKRKFFLVYEGATTENIYFEAVEKNRIQININPLIELVPLMRDYSEENWSNPKKILDRILQHLKEYNEDIISYETLLNGIMAYLKEHNVLSSHGVSEKITWKTLLDICDEMNSKKEDIIIKDVNIV